MVGKLLESKKKRHGMKNKGVPIVAQQVKNLT